MNHLIVSAADGLIAQDALQLSNSLRGDTRRALLENFSMKSARFVCRLSGRTAVHPQRPLPSNTRTRRRQCVRYIWPYTTIEATTTIRPLKREEFFCSGFLLTWIRGSLCALSRRFRADSAPSEATEKAKKQSWTLSRRVWYENFHWESVWYVCIGLQAIWTVRRSDRVTGECAGRLKCIYRRVSMIVPEVRFTVRLGTESSE